MRLLEVKRVKCGANGGFLWYPEGELTTETENAPGNC
jgi:hypothetical protein